MLYAVHDGIGESIEWDDLTEEFLKQKLSNLLQDKKYGTCSENNIKNDCWSLKTCASETEFFCFTYLKQQMSKFYNFEFYMPSYITGTAKWLARS